MPLYYHPKQGDVLLCDFTRGFVAPEMLKIRKVVVISPTATHSRKLCTVVPISSTTHKLSRTGTTCSAPTPSSPMATKSCG